MGVCSSCEAVRPAAATAKVILQDGRLQEYASPVKVWSVLQAEPGCFLCDSDEMEFDDVVTAVDGDEELRPGQIYFVLPMNRLRRPLEPQEMAALAVKASSALMKGGECGCRSDIVFYSGGEKAARGKGRRSGGGGRRRRVFTANLGAIPE